MRRGWQCLVRWKYSKADMAGDNEVVGKTSPSQAGFSHALFATPRQKALVPGTVPRTNAPNRAATRKPAENLAGSVFYAQTTHRDVHSQLSASYILVILYK